MTNLSFAASSPYWCRVGVKVTHCLLLAFAILILNARVTAQAPGPLPGIQLGSTNEFGIDLSTGNINIQVPIRNSSVGPIPISIFSVANFGAQMVPRSTNWIVPIQSFGTAVNGLLGATPSTQIVPNYCGSSYQSPGTEYFGLFDSTGTFHGLSSPFILGPSAPNGECLSSGQGTVGDGSGYYISVAYSQNGNTVTIRDKYGYTDVGGMMTNPDSVSASSTSDTCPEAYAEGCTAIIGPLSSTPLLNVGFNSTVPYPSYFFYTDANGATQQYTVSSSEFTVNANNFQCTSAPPSSRTLYLPTAITLPGSDGQYSFTYEATPGVSGAVTGRIASITYPSGGSISYSYSGGESWGPPPASTNSGYNCVSGVVPTLTVTTNDNNGNKAQWKYVNNNTTGSNGSGNFTFTVVRSDPSGNQVVYTFNGEFIVEKQVYQGSANGTPLLTTVYCYNGNTSSCSSPSSLIQLPLTEVDTYTTPNGYSLSTRTQVKYDSIYGNMTYLAQYDYRASSPSRQQILDYGQSWNGSGCNSYPSGSFIHSTPCYVATLDGSGNTIAATQYTYSNTGHPTMVKQLTSGSNWLTSSATYNSNGTLATATDVNGAVSTYSYNGTDGCNGLLPTSVSVSGYLVSLSTSAEWNCNGGVPTQTTDVNKNNTTYAYNDPLWRVTSMTDPMGDTTSYTYLSPTSTEIALNNLNSGLILLNTVDGLGRPIFSQRWQPAGSNYVTVQTSYGWNSTGATTSVTMPYAGTQAQPAPSKTPSTTTQYDALSRPLTITDGDAGTTTYQYNQNDVLQSIGPSPVVFQKQLEYDGLGRLTSVCEINSLSGSGPCVQNNAESGFFTGYTYDALGNLLTVAQNSQKGAIGGQQTRTYTYDGLSRLTSESNPETGSIGYAYDSVASPGCAGWTSQPGDLIATNYFGNGSFVCQVHDGLHRLVYTASSDCIFREFSYDNTSNGNWQTPPSGATFVNTAGNLVEAETSNCANQGTAVTDEWFSYDANGRTTDLYASAPNSGGFYHTTASYWSNNVQKTLAFGILNGNSLLPNLSYGLDGQGRPDSVTASSGQNPVISMTYVLANGTGQPVGSLAAVNFGSGDSDSYSYDTKTGRMTGYSSNVAGQFSTGSLGWNLNGTLGELITANAFNNFNQTCNFGYDALSRITSDSCQGGNWGQTFSYDAFGNISKSGSISWLPNYNSPVNNQYLSGWNGATYDGRGDMTEDTFGNSFTWSAYSGMASVNGQAITYDALGRMVANSGGKQQFVYSPAGGQPLAVMNGQTPYDIYVPLPGGAFAMYNSTGLFQYNHPDWRGTAVLLSNPNQSQGNTPYYAPFGEGYAQPGWVQFTSAGNPWTLNSGSENDGETLDDFLYRRYSATQSRWISPDPAGLASANPANPQSWNRYAYVMNNPLSAVDPFGLDCVTVSNDFGDLAGEGAHVGVAPGDGDCSGDNSFYFDGTVDPSSVIIDPQTGNVWASVNGGALMCAGDSSCPSTVVNVAANNGPGCDNACQLARAINATGVQTINPSAWPTKQWAKSYFCGSSPANNIRNWTLEGAGKGFVVGAVSGGVTGTVLGTPVGGFFGAILGGLIDGTVTAGGGVFGGSAASAVCSALGVYQQ